MNDHLEIRGLQVDARIGVPAAERAAAQRLLVDLRLFPRGDFSRMPDEIAATVDYHAVTRDVIALAADSSCRLIETLADRIATTILRGYAVRRVEVSVRKFILPDTEFVAAHCVRER